MEQYLDTKERNKNTMSLSRSQKKSLNFGNRNVQCFIISEVTDRVTENKRQNKKTHLKEACHCNQSGYSSTKMASFKFRDNKQGHLIYMARQSGKLYSLHFEDGKERTEKKQQMTEKVPYLLSILFSRKRPNSRVTVPSMT